MFVSFQQMRQKWPSSGKKTMVSIKQIHTLHGDQMRFLKDRGQRSSMPRTKGKQDDDAMQCLIFGFVFKILACYPPQWYAFFISVFIFSFFYPLVFVTMDIYFLYVVLQYSE